MAYGKAAAATYNGIRHCSSERMRRMKAEEDNLTDVYAVAYISNGNYQIKLVDAPPTNTDEYAKVLEPMGNGEQLVLWVPEGTPGTTAQNLATHFVPQIRNMRHSV